jgi:hypothetical protein
MKKGSKEGLKQEGDSFAGDHRMYIHFIRRERSAHLTEGNT